jgi:hypothetical protein
MSRGPVIFSLSYDTTNAVRTRATQFGVPYSQLVDLYIRYAHDRLTDEALTAWAKGREARALTKAEVTCLEALQRLSERGTPWKFPPEDVGLEAGLPTRVAFRALSSLRAKGICGVEDSAPGELDRWGRPAAASYFVVEIDAERQARHAKRAEE